MTVSIPPDLRPDPSKPLRIVGWDDSRLSTNPEKPDQLLIDWVLSRPLTDFEIRVIEDMQDDDPDVLFADDDGEKIRSAGRVDNMVAQIVELDRRLQVIEQAAMKRQRKHEDVLSAARKALSAMNWE